MTSENPYRKPLLFHGRRLQSLRWQMPFVPQAVIALALLLVLCLLAVLYATVGIAAQISDMCLTLMGDARQQFGTAQGVEKSAYLVAVVIYAVVFVPFWLVQTPVLLAGWGVQRLADSPRRPDIRRPSFARREYISPRFSESRR